MPATSCYCLLHRCLAVLFRPAGRQLLFQSGVFCQAASFSPSCWLPESSAPPSGFRCFLPEGRGFYRFAALPVNRCFVDSLDPSALSSRASSSGARLLPPPRLLSTRCVDRRIPYFSTDSLEVPSAPARGLLCEGWRLLSPPRLLSTGCVDRRIPYSSGRRTITASGRADQALGPQLQFKLAWLRRSGARSRLSTCWCWPPPRPC